MNKKIILSINLLSFFMFGCVSNATNTQKNNDNYNNAIIKNYNKPLYALLTKSGNKYSFSELSERYSENLPYVNIYNLEPTFNKSNLRKNCSGTNALGNKGTSNEASCRPRDELFQKKDIHVTQAVIGGIFSLGAGAALGIHSYDIIFDKDLFENAVNEALEGFPKDLIVKEFEDYQKIFKDSGSEKTFASSFKIDNYENLEKKYGIFLGETKREADEARKVTERRAEEKRKDEEHRTEEKLAIETRAAAYIASIVKSAEQGDANSQGKLGAMYCSGEGVPMDYGKGFEWLKKSAEQGDASSQLLVGNLYYLGNGVEVNKVDAYAWTSLAVAQNEEKAAESRDVIASELTSNEFFAAQALAEELQKKIPNRAQNSKESPATSNSQPPPAPVPTQPKSVIATPQKNYGAPWARGEEPSPPPPPFPKQDWVDWVDIRTGTFRCYSGYSSSLNACMRGSKEWSVATCKTQLGFTCKQLPR